MPRERNTRAPRLSPWIVAVAVMTAALAGACSVNRWSEDYEPGGALLHREWRSDRAGSVAEAEFSAEQVAGAYNVRTGATSSVDPQVAEIIRVPVEAAASMYGLHALRTAPPDGALAPVSVGGMYGLQAAPITAEQAQVYADRAALAQALQDLAKRLDALEAAREGATE